jgi:hypothetical protein
MYEYMLLDLFNIAAGLSEDRTSYMQRILPELNAAGEDGWELAAILGPIAYFKRPIRV